ncbi:hypothetical protein [Hyphomonas sp. CY54-11-8]|uniref:hypothetical protein n=1 Tax=Hyphomonas sp. CY54-11-8 TaxID=1280944 RepID=UPI000458BBB0|nr:hypothetical protein [Hyphomonas sp. CY54-11-8]KCZ47749.1 hypothetical protein HY17_04535 [Hyphomonas sp. CY54-11-8]
MTDGQQAPSEFATYGFNLCGLVIAGALVIGVPLVAFCIGAVFGFIAAQVG